MSSSDSTTEMRGQGQNTSFYKEEFTWVANIGGKGSCSKPPISLLLREGFAIGTEQQLGEIQEESWAFRNGLVCFFCALEDSQVIWSCDQ